MRGRTGLCKAGLGGWAASVCLVSDWVTSLRISPQTCTGLTAAAFAVHTVSRPCRQCSRVCSCHRHADEVSAVLSVFFSSSGSDVDCAGWGLALLPFSVVEYHVVRKVAWGGPGGGLPNSFNPATGNVFGIHIVMGLRPSAAIVKVMSVPDSRCVRVVTPDDHVNIGFHEVLIHDLEDEELPFVALSELRCLRLDWPKTVYFHVQISV